MNEALKKITAALKSPKALITLGLCGILLILVSTLIPSGGKKSTASGTASESAGAEEYRLSLEKSIGGMVAGITGDTQATVVVTLESGIRYSYADATTADVSSSSGQNTSQQSSSSTQSYITVKTADGGEQALLVTEIMPEVRGVAVICSGGDNEQIAAKIRSAVMAALDITSKRVYIAGGSSHEKR